MKEEGDTVSLEENEAIIRRLTLEANRRNLGVLDELMASDYVDHTLQSRGRENVKQFYTMAFKDFPDLYKTIKDIIAGGDKVWVRYKNTATDPTGKKIELASINIFRIVNGKVVEGWGGVIRKMSVPKVTGELYDKLGITKPTEKAKTLLPEDVS